VANRRALTESFALWLRKHGLLSLCSTLATLLSAAMIFWMFRKPLAPILGIDGEALLPFIVSTWHWVAAWCALWTVLSVGLIQVFGVSKGAVFSGSLAISIGFGTWLASQAHHVDLTQPVVASPALVAFWGGWLTVQFARLRIILQRQIADASPQRKRHTSGHARPDLTEHFIYVFVSLLGLGVVALQFIWPGTDLDERTAFGDQLGPSLIFVLMIATAFLPLLFGFWFNAKIEAIRTDRKFWRGDVVSPLSFGFIVAAVVGVAALAFYAARHASANVSAAISYATFVGVFLLFFLVIVTPHVANYIRRRSEQHITVTPLGIASLDVPALWLSYVDTVLVKVIAPVSGGTQSRFSHLHVIAILSLLSLLGLIIPRPFGLVPVVLGILLAVSLGRRWAWVEEDRETASRLVRTKGSNIHLGFENDLKDEALTGYAGLFILVPLTLYQIQDLTHFIPPLQEQNNILLTWIAFFGGELAKAVPFVDWWDIYGNDALSPVGKHLTFLSRAAVDLVILSALFQALSIWQRDQVQTKLFKEGHLDAFDPFKEREFFERGIIRLLGEMPDNKMTGKHLAQAERFKKRIEELRTERRLAFLDQKGVRHYFEVREDFKQTVEEHIKQRRRLLNEASNVYESPAPYSRQRLGELIEPSQPDDLRAGAKWMIDRWGVLVGTPREQLGQLAEQWVRRDFPNIPQDTGEDQSRYIRTQKMAFERILIELASRQWIDQIVKGDVSNLMQCLCRVINEVEFDFARILSFELFANLRTEYSVMFLSKFVLQNADLETQDRWRLRMIAVAEGPDTALRAGRSDMRERVYDAAGRIACNPRAGNRARRAAHELLVWMGAADGAQSGRDRASAVAATAAQCLLAAGLFDQNLGDDDPHEG